MHPVIPPGLIALHGNRAEDLADTVFAWLKRQPLGPLEEEVVLVQSNGMAEWFKMALASQGGVCAATRVELPARFMWRTYRQVLGREQVPAHSATDKSALTWRLMHLLPSLLAQEGFEPVAGFLEADEPDRLFQLASRLADLFDQYQVYRPDWLEAWGQGTDALAAPTRADVPVPPDQRWQPLLWRALMATLSESEQATIRPRLHERVLHALQSDAPTATPLARRVVLFGMTHVPLATLHTLAALATRSQVLLAIPNPCRFHWADIMDGRELLRLAHRRHPLREGRDLAALPLDQMHAHAHPLLASWGRQGRDFVRQLDAFDEARMQREDLPVPRVDLFDDDDPVDACLLTQVQHRIRDLTPLAEHPPRTLSPTDRSIVFHVAHSIVREVEVLHDQLLHMLADTGAQPRLQPRDVVVMVPDIDTVAPAIRAVFGQYPRHDARHIPFDIADLSTRANSPMVGVLDWLLRLPQHRCRFTELRDLLDVPSVAARFGLPLQDLPTLTRWMTGAGIRWGLDQAQRADLDLAACGDQNTGWFGLRRMLLGYAAGGTAFDGIEPYDEVAGLDAELAGSLACLLDRLQHWWGVMRLDATPMQWAERGRALLADVFKPVDEADRQTLGALDDALNAWLDACDQAGFDEPVPLQVARTAWLDELEQPTLNKRFRAGGVTFCTLMPMRAIPFEVVCLLGMNDGDYPRRSTRSDFDLMALPGQIRPGDRSGRDDDRQLMLEALLSARRTLYVSWTGRSVRDNAEQPPSVLVSQLRDYLAAGWGEAVLPERTTEHPLQPFSRRYFEPGSALFTHAREWRAAHVAAEVDEAHPRADTALALSLSLSGGDERAPLTAAQLTAFLRNPVKAFFKETLHVVFDEIEADGADDESFKLQGLEAHHLVDDLLKQVQAQMAPELQDLATLDVTQAASHMGALITSGLQQLRDAGHLPLGALGDRNQQQLGATLQPMLSTWLQVLADHPVQAQRQHVEVRHEGIVLDDWLDQLRRASDDSGDLIALSVMPGGITDGGKGEVPRVDKLLAHWVRSLLAAHHGLKLRSIVVARDAVLTISPAPADGATEVLQTLLSHWRDGLREPLPVAPRTALVFLTDKDAEPTYEGGFQKPGEVEEACLARTFPDFEALTADGRFDALAEAMYRPLSAWAAAHVKAQPHGDGAAHDEEADA